MQRKKRSAPPFIIINFMELDREIENHCDWLAFAGPFISFDFLNTWLADRPVATQLRRMWKYDVNMPINTIECLNGRGRAKSIFFRFKSSSMPLCIVFDIRISCFMCAFRFSIAAIRTRSGCRSSFWFWLIDGQYEFSNGHDTWWETNSTSNHASKWTNFSCFLLLRTVSEP